MSRLSPALEGYLETIHELKLNKGTVRVKDIAASLNVKAPSVHEALHHLVDKGYITHEHYRPVELTKQGEQSAKALNERHSVLCTFFTDVLGVSKESADKDACTIEHYLSEETIDSFIKFLETLDKKR